MSKFKKKIVVTGGTGRFASYLKKNPGNFSKNATKIKFSNIAQNE